MTPGVEHESPTWRALKKHITARIAELQIHLEALNGRDYTAMLRGQIKELRGLIGAVEPDEPAELNNETTGPLY